MRRGIFFVPCTSQSGITKDMIKVLLYSDSIYFYIILYDNVIVTYLYAKNMSIFEINIYINILDGETQ